MGQNLTSVLLLVTQAIIFLGPNLRGGDTKLQIWWPLRNEDWPVLVRTVLAEFQVHAQPFSVTTPNFIFGVKNPQWHTNVGPQMKAHFSL